MTGALMRAVDVTRKLDDFQLGPVSLALEPGLIYAVVGPNGSGKTTLFNLLMGLIQPDTGSIEHFGEEYTPDDVSRSQRIAWVPEALVGHEDWNVQEINELYRRAYPRFDTRLLQELQAGVDRHKHFSALSKGMQRRAILAAALASRPEVLLCDEPTDGLDPFARQDLLNHLSTYMEDEQRTLLIATHNLEDIRRIADVVIVLENGRQVGTWEKDDLLGGWHRLWLAQNPSRTLAGERSRTLAGGVQLVSNDLVATRADLQALGIDIINTQPLDLVETLRIVIEARVGERESVRK